MVAPQSGFKAAIFLLRNLIFVLILSSLARTTYCQSTAKDWQILNAQHSSGKLSDIAYFNKIQSLTDKYIKEDGLKENLERYRQLAWSKNQYQSYRYQYYAFLANNAAFTHQEGAAIYYLEKSEQELKKSIPYINSLNETRQLLAIYGSNDNYNSEKRKEIFTNAYPFIKTLPQLVLHQDIPSKTCINAMTILNHAGRLYAKFNDTAMLQSIEQTATLLWQNILKNNKIKKDKLQQCRYLYYQIEYTVALDGKDFVKAKNILDNSYQLLRMDTSINPMWARAVEQALIRKYIDFFISQKQPDSSKYYVKLLAEKINRDDPGDGTAHLLYTAKVDALHNNYSEAYKHLLRAYEINDSAINLKIADINNNMYAQLLSEQKQESINQMQHHNTTRNYIVGIFSFLTIITIALLLWKIKRNNKEAKARVEKLNRLTQIEIAELELRANSIQRKMGMELHDDVAGQLVHLCTFIDKEIIASTIPNQVQTLKSIRHLANETYQHTRTLSHEWHTEGSKEEQHSFAESIRKLAAYALPNERYERTIEIDEHSLHKVSYKLRIELLKIVQEAFINIIKHSGANKMQLFIYQEEDDTIVTQISDNGKGFATNDKSRCGIGLNSIRERVQNVNGIFDITSATTGVELIITLPIK